MATAPLLTATPSGDRIGATYTAYFGGRASGPPRAAKKPKSHRRSKYRHVRHHKKSKKRGGPGQPLLTIRPRVLKTP